MVLLSIEDLVLRRGDRELVRASALELRAGWRVGLVGANGSGKSTLLTVLAGRMAPAEGRIRRPPGVEIQLFEQATDPTWRGSLWEIARREAGSLEALEAELERLRRQAADPSDEAAGLRYAEALSAFERRGGFTLEARLRAGLTRLGVPEALWPLPAADASGGERQRARLVGALCAGSDVLLLDEPSNHLDLRGRDWLAERILAREGLVVLASHDRGLLDRVCTHVGRIEADRLVVRRGGYARVVGVEATEARAAERAARARAARRVELERMAAELARYSNRGAQVRKRRADRERAALTAAVVPEPAAAHRPRPAHEAGPASRDDGRERPTGLLLRARHLRAEGVVLDANLELSAGQRIALLGPSGCGKSTLMALVAGTRPSDDPRSHLAWRSGTSLLYLDQRWRGLAPEASPRQSLEAWVTSARASGALAAAGLPRSTWDREVASLSGGELARAALALLAVREADVVLLDEPTNDLDLPGIEALEQQLLDSDAAIVLASHDETLVRTLQAEVVSIESGELVRYRGGIDGYRRGSRRLEAGLEVAGAAITGTSAAPGRPAGGGGESGPAVDEDRAVDEARAAAEAALEDPTRWSERSRQRWRERRAAAEAALLAAWEARATPPAPRFRTREGGVAVLADRDGDGLRVVLERGPGLRVRRVGTVAHLVPEELSGRCTLPWAWRALCFGAARLALYLLPVEAVQVASGEGLDGGPFERYARPWWVARREALERSEGWLRASAERRRTRRRRRRRLPAG